MGFKFSFLCDLLSSLENARVVKASTAARNNDPAIKVVTRWFAQHDKRIHHKDTDQRALLSCMFPEKLPERIYWLQHTSLARVIGRCLLLGLSRREELERWRVSGGVDLGECVENVMRQAENYISDGQEVTVEEIDAVLIRLASRCRFSGPRVQRQHTAVDVEECLGPLYRRMSSRDAKWLTRMILKSYSPVLLPVTYVLRRFHFLLPSLLLFQDSFDSALDTLASEKVARFPPHPEPGLAEDLATIALDCLNPKTGVKIGRPDYYKARSIKHCCRMVDRRRMSIERKYDGEYCQIHIDLSKQPNIQIFSKSGKDSTMDRSGIHRVLRESLRIGSPNCKFSKRCILEGELLVWSDKHGRIMDFHKLRKFISRSGTFIGTENDSLYVYPWSIPVVLSDLPRPQPYEHLMVVFFDILVLDDNVCLKKPHRERRLLLKDVVQAIHGRADISEQQILDFSRTDGPYQLERIFAKGIAQRWEGFVLKGCEDPYFTIFSSDTNGTFGRWIKLKKDYIPGLGDTVDLALVGAKYEPRDVAALKRIPKLLWTHFFIGCLLNKDAVLQLGATPRFRVVDVINQHCMSLRNMQILNQFGEFVACNPASNHEFKFEYERVNLPSMDVMFKTPFVVEMLGSGFEKPSGARYFALRFPRITKVHWDRTFKDAASFQELQVMAEKARSVTAEDDSSQEHWCKHLKLANGACQYINNGSQDMLSESASMSESDVEDSTGIGSGEVDTKVMLPTPPCARNSSRIGRFDTGAANGQANNIPIQVDDTALSPASSSESDICGNPLAENPNQSSYQNSRARKGNARPDKLAASASTAVKETDTNVDTFKDQSTRGAVAPRFLETEPNERPANRTGYPSEASASSTIMKQQIRLVSPLLILPQYQCDASSLDQYPAKSTRYTHSPDDLLHQMTSQYHNTASNNFNHYTTSQNLSLGLVLLSQPSSLGSAILNITKTLSQSLKTDLKCPSNGKIFFLDSNVLNLGTGPEDTRFCLRATWENISKVYFYACVSWSVPATTAITTAQPLRSIANGDEIPYTSIYGDDVQPSSPILDQRRKPSITVNFEKEELKCLGEFVSTEPLVHVDGHVFIS